MDARMKDCPSCKRQIQTEASFCPFCGARFEVSYQGYCNTCHAIKPVDTYNHCLTCGGEVIDRQASSRYISESPSQAVMQDVNVEKPKKKSRRLSCVGCLLLWIGLGTVLILLLLPSPQFKEFMRELPIGTFLPSVPQAGQTEAASNPQAVVATATKRATRTPAPTPTPDIRFPVLTRNAVCLMTYKYGMNCLESSGWIQIPPSDFPRGSNPLHVASCGGKMVLLSSAGLYRYGEGRWSEIGDMDVSYPAWVGCGAGNTLWLADADTASYFDGSTWSDYPFSEALAGQTYTTVKGIAAGVGKEVWIATQNAVLHYVGQKWTVFDKSHGFNKEYQFSGIAVDRTGKPWAAHADGLARYDGKTWSYVGPPGSTTINTVVVDSQDRVWVGTDGGVSVYNNGAWQRYPIGNQAGEVNSIALDERGRVWAATSWGLAVLVDGKWNVYQMSNADLLMNSITHVTVGGIGPELPAMMEKEPGRINGRLLNGGQPLTKARVEVCMQPLGMFFRGATPCAEQPTRASATTDEDGYYSITDLPPGYYSVTFQTPDSKWKIFSNKMSIGGVQVLVEAGMPTQMDDMDINKN